MVQWIVLIGLLTPLLGCSFGKNSNHSEVSEGEYHGVVEGVEEDIKVTCAEGVCPESVGVLIGFRSHPQQNGVLDIFSCGASLVESKSTIATAGHCDLLTADADGSSWEKVLFVTVSTEKNPQEIREVTESLYSKHEEGRPEFQDAAWLALNSPIQSVRPLQLARQYPQSLTSFVTFVTNRVGDKRHLHFVVSQKKCDVHWGVVEFPFQRVDKPDTLLGWNCTISQSHSGSPLFADSQFNRLDGILSGGDNALIRKKNCTSGSIDCVDSAPNLLRDRATATTAACLPLPGMKPPERCVHVQDSILALKRRELFREQEVLQARHFLEDGDEEKNNLPFRRWPIAIELKAFRKQKYYDIPASSYGFYLFMVPRCGSGSSASLSGSFEEKAAFFSVRRDPYSRLVSERMPGSDIPLRTQYQMQRGKVIYRHLLPSSPEPQDFLGFTPMEDGQALVDLMRGQTFSLPRCPP